MAQDDFSKFNKGTKHPRECLKVNNREKQIILLYSQRIWLSVKEFFMG